MPLNPLFFSDFVINSFVICLTKTLGKAHLKKTYLGQCPNRGGGSDRIPTSLTDYPSDRGKLSKLQNKVSITK